MRGRRVSFRNEGRLGLGGDFLLCFLELIWRLMIYRLLFMDHLPLEQEESQTSAKPGKLITVSYPLKLKPHRNESSFMLSRENSRGLAF